MAKILALAGKGGVGKTTISAAFVRILGETYPGARILAIDADPAVGLATALGVEVKVTLDDLRREIIDKAAAGAGKEAVELLGEVRFRIFDALVETEHFAFLAIGRPEGAGCYCAVNAYLKEVIDMVSKDFDYVVIDGEAGIEQINRRVMEKVTHLFLVTDASKRGFQVARSIKKVADDLVLYEKCALLLNRVDGSKGTVLFDPLLSKMEKTESEIACGAMGEAFAEIIAVIATDPAQAENDIWGRSIFLLPINAPVYQGALAALNRMGILKE